MADQDPEENRFPPVKVEWRGRFLVVTGNERDPRFAQASLQATHNFLSALGPAQQGSAESISDLQSAPSCSSTSDSPPQTQSLSLTQLQNDPNSDPPFPPSTNPLVSSSQTQSSAGPPLRTTSLPLSLGKSGSGSGSSRLSRSGPPFVSLGRSGSGSGSSRLNRSGPPFASLSMAFFSPQPQQTPFPQLQTPQFQFQPQQQQMQYPQMQAQYQVPQPQLLLYTKDKVPAGWSTKFEDLHQESQNVLLQIEGRLREYRDESMKLDQCIRLYDSSVSNDSFEVDASRIVQEIGGTNTAIEREKASLQELVTSVKDMIRSTELAIHTYMMLRPRFVRPATGPAENNGSAATQPTNQIIPASPSMPVFDFYSGVPKRPSAFMQHTAERLQKFLEECVRWIEELEQLVQIDANRRCSDSLEALPKVMSNVHGYFIYVASKVEKLHQYMESMKTTYLIEQRRHGDDADPFLEANRREAARLEAAARLVHPTLHLPATQNPPHQLNTSNQTPTFQQPSLQPTPAGFSTPAPASSSGGLFSTPSGSAPSSALFGPSVGFPQSTPFGSTSGSLFGSTPAPSGFGSTTPGLASTPAVGGGSTLFATPSFGGATASGASFGGASKSSRPKTRTARR